MQHYLWDENRIMRYNQYDSAIDLHLHDLHDLHDLHAIFDYNITKGTGESTQSFRYHVAIAVCPRSAGDDPEPEGGVKQTGFSLSLDDY